MSARVFFYASWSNMSSETIDRNQGFLTCPNLDSFDTAENCWALNNRQIYSADSTVLSLQLAEAVFYSVGVCHVTWRHDTHDTWQWCSTTVSSLTMMARGFDSIDLWNGVRCNPIFQKNRAQRKLPHVSSIRTQLPYVYMKSSKELQRKFIYFESWYLKAKNEEQSLLDLMYSIPVVTLDRSISTSDHNNIIVRHSFVHSIWKDGYVSKSLHTFMVSACCDRAYNHSVLTISDRKSVV